jgi:Stress responsive A/B Barrel Domain
MAAEQAAREAQLAHIVFFALNDSTPENRRKLVAACETHLKGHPGEVYFSAGTPNPDLKREVNDRDFDVALHVVFENHAAHDAYQSAPRHLKFIEENKATWKKVRVFDSDLR